jgi:hypothetical protein
MRLPSPFSVLGLVDWRIDIRDEAAAGNSRPVSAVRPDNLMDPGVTVG